MRLRALPRGRLRELVPPLLHTEALVALLPLTGNRRWAGAAAWDVARAAATAARRVALVDLCIEDPSLHEARGLTPAEGIVDAFEYGVSLTKVAHEVDGVFFIGTGCYTAHAGELLAQERWRRLHAGFRSEGALLLLYLTPEALAHLAAIPDGAMVLAPEPVTSASTAARALEEVAQRGTPILGVVQDRWSAPAVPPSSSGRPGPRRGWGRAAVAAGLAGAAAVGWAVFARSAAPPPMPAAPAPSPTAASRPADSLPWTVQLAAYGTLEGAWSHAEALTADGVPALIAPVVLQETGPVWYRVLAGSYPARASATAARAAFWENGAARTGEGDVLQAPYSLLISAAPSAAPAPTLDSLRRLGIPATVWPDGRVLVGAFETPEQAAFAQAALARAAVPATLVTRTGTTP